MLTHHAKNILSTLGSAALTLAVLAVLLVLIIKTLRRITRGPIAPIRGKVTSHFGKRNAPVAGASTYHTGVDIAAEVGTSVKAPWPGKVTKAFNDKSYGGGYTMVMEHTNGYKTGYCHLSEFVAHEGDTVRAGKTICRTGNSGRSSDPHLHFSVTDPTTGQKINPETIFNFKA